MKYQSILGLSLEEKFDTVFYSAGLVSKSSVDKNSITESRRTKLSLTSLRIEMPMGRTAMNSD